MLRGDLGRILRQRNALLRQAAGRVTSDVALTLDVWDAKLSATGDELRRRRLELLDAMRPRLAAAYGRVARHGAQADATYLSSWGEEPLADALGAARKDDLRRATSTIGPHRDDVALWIDGRPARSHASQGEQRSLALALRLAVDAAVRERRGVRPVLLLDDVFSELDRDRARGPAGDSARGPADPHRRHRASWWRAARLHDQDQGRRSERGGPVTPDGPEPVGDALERLLGTLEAPSADLLATVFGRWEEVVGATVAQHCRPAAVEGDRLVVLASDAVWASELQWLSNHVLDRINEMSGTRPLRSFTVRVEPSGP